MESYNLSGSPTYDTLKALQGLQMDSILKFTPTEYIEFNVSPDMASSQIITMENLTSSEVSYKVKTTNLQGYSVKPSAGTIPAKGEQEIKIHLFPIPLKSLLELDRYKESSSSRAALMSKDRFLIESYEVLPAYASASNAVEKSRVFKQKLYVIFRIHSSEIEMDDTEEKVNASKIYESSHQGEEAPNYISERQLYTSPILPGNVKNVESHAQYHNNLAEFVKINEIEAEIARLKTKQDDIDNRLDALQDVTLKSNGPAYSDVMSHFSTYQMLILILIAVLVVKLITKFF